MDKYDLGMAALIVTGIAILLAFLYGVLIYNNSQNIKRDEFYAEHCKDVTREVTFGTQYRCGVQK